MGVTPRESRNGPTAVAHIIAAATLAVLCSGCAFIEGIFNPDAMWAINESTPMSVVMRRAELAENVADHVDRMIGAAPLNKKVRGQLRVEKDAAKTRLEEIGAEPVYGGQPLRVVPAEVWLDHLSQSCAEDSDASTLIELLGDDVAEEYAEVAAQGVKLARAKAQISQLEDELDDAKGKSKAKKEKKIAKLEKKVEKLEASYPDKVDKLVEHVQKAAAKLEGKQKKRAGFVVLNLLEAVEDAQNANSAAMIRYPMAVPSLHEDLQKVVPRLVADVIEEQTGHRPRLNGFSPKIGLKDGDVELSLNGIPADKLGDIELDELLVEVTERAERYVGDVLTLVVDASTTEERLSLQHEILSAYREGLGVSLDSEPRAVDISDLEVVASAAKKKKSDDEDEPKAVKRSATGITVAQCSVDGDDEPVVADKKKRKKKTKVAKKKRKKKKKKKTKVAKRKRKKKKKTKVANKKKRKRKKTKGPTQPAKHAPKAPKKDEVEWIDDPTAMN